MKKFTKGCLFASLILFALGAAMYCVFGLLGGFRQLKSNAKAYELGWNGLKWGYMWGDYGLNFGILDELNDLGYELISLDDGFPGALNEIVMRNQDEQTGYTADDITDMNIDIGTACLVIEESEDEYVHIENDATLMRVKYGMDGGAFNLYAGKGTSFFNLRPRGTIYLRLPKGMELNSLDIAVGAASMDGMSLEAKTIGLEAGAGEFNIESVTADKVSMDIGAGTVSIGILSAKEAEISAGAGTIDIENAKVRDMDIDASAGSAIINGMISGNLNVNCAAGSVDMVLQGSESEHNYDIECDMGTVEIGKNTYSGLSREQHIDNGSSSNFTVECSVGSVAIEFEN